MVRVPHPYVWLVWSGAFVVAWAGFCAACPRLRTVLWQVSLFTLPFALTEPLFVGRYWRPPTVLNLAGAGTQCDVESFLFCFGIGGVAAVLYNVVFRTPVRVPPKTPAQRRYEQAYVLAFLFPFLLYLPLQGLLDRPLWTGVALMAGGALVRAVLFPTLRAKTFAGGFLFLGYYAVFLALLTWIAPGYIGRVWLRDIPGGRVFGIPWAELAFAFTAGMFWSGGYEQALWLFAPAERQLHGSPYGRPAVAPAGNGAAAGGGRRPVLSSRGRRSLWPGRRGRRSV
jgi:hypothetical protein